MQRDQSELEKDEELAGTDGEDVPEEPQEVAVTTEEVNLLLAEHQKTSALKVRGRGQHGPVRGWGLLNKHR